MANGEQPQHSVRNEGNAQALRHGGAAVAVLYGIAVLASSQLLFDAPILIQAALTSASFILFVIFWKFTFQQKLSFVDAGVLFQFVVVLYTVYPLVIFYAFDFQLLSVDARLYHIALSEDIIQVVWLCSQFVMAGFGSAYLAFRHARLPVLPADYSSMIPALWAGLAGAGVIAMVVTVLRGGGGYLDEYQFIANLPTLVVQALNISYALITASLFGLMACYARERPPAALALAAVATAFFFLTTDARTQIMLIAAGLVICFDHFRKRITPSALAVSAVLGVGGFLALGILREGGDVVVDAAGRTEFVAVFVTALDIQQLYVTGSTLNMNANLLISDIFRLIPQQLLTFEKVDPASWYVNTFYPYFADAGGGLAFGMIAESLLGGGPWVALVRGVVLGGLVALAANALTRRASVLRVIIYIWLLASIYQCFRDTTFTLVGRFLFQFGPAVLVLIALSKLLPGRKAPALA